MAKKRREETEEQDEKIVKPGNIDSILFNSRIVFLYGVIDTEMAREINKQLLSLYIKDNTQPILMEINSCGGSCTEGLSIIDAMASIPNPIITHIVGKACSMATLISIVGDKRLMSPNSYWMTHPMSGWNADYLEFMKDSIDWLKKLDRRLNNIYKKHTKLSKKDYFKLNNGELWLSATQCKKKGIVDIIG